MTIQMLSYGRPVLRLPRPGLILQRVKKQLLKKPSIPIDFIQTIFQNFNLVINAPVQVLAGAFRSETWVVQTDAGKKVLKRYKANLTREQILHEHSILHHLARVDFAAPRLVSDQAGSSLFEHENRFYALTDFLEGHYKFNHYLYFPNQDAYWFHAMGRSLGELHLALCDFTPLGYNQYGFETKTGRRFMDLNWLLETLEKNRLASADRRGSRSLLTGGSPEAMRANLASLAEKADWLGKQLVSLEQDLSVLPLSRQVIHGDFGPYNLMVSPRHRLVPIDFELSRIEWRLVDLVAAFSSSTTGKQRLDPLQAMRLIAHGYQSVNPIPKEEWQVLPQVWQFVLLRRLVICWNQYLEQGSQARLDEACRRLAKLNWIEQTNPALRSLVG